MVKSNKLLIGAVLAGAAALAWGAAIFTFLFLDPSLAQWTALVTVVALVSEGALWGGVVLLGFTALDRFRMLSRSRPSGSAKDQVSRR